jgi:hypothetical protein
MKALGDVVGVVLAVLEALMESVVAVMIRGILWFAIAAWFSPGVATIMVVAVFLEPITKVLSEVLDDDSFELIRIGGDVVLSILAWIAVTGLTDNWLLGGGLVAGVWVYFWINS